MAYRDFLSDGQGGWTTLRTVRYTYYAIGHVSNITIKDEYPGYGDPDDYDWYYDLALYYTSDHKLWRVLWDKWKVNQQGQFTNYTKLAAREFFYDGPRQRWVARDLDPDDWQPTYPERWTDYLGQMPYQDYDVTVTQQWQAEVDERMRYLCAAGVNAQQSVTRDGTQYLHGDLIDSTMLTTDNTGAALSGLSCTAFGEPIGDPALLGTRY